MKLKGVGIFLVSRGLGMWNLGLGLDFWRSC